MSDLRKTPVPTSLLEAEVAAFPLASYNAFKLAETSLSDRSGGASPQLWEQAENHFSRHFRGTSLDLLTYLRDQLWFSAAEGEVEGERRTEIPLHLYLQRVASRFLVSHGNFAQPRIERERYPEDDELGFRARRRWRWVSLSLPPDLLMSALDDRCYELELMAPVTRQLLLDRGFAETHFHLGAAFDFPSLWVGSLWQAGQIGFNPEKEYQSAGADLKGGREIGDFLLRAAIARYLTGRFLHYRTSLGGRLNYSRYFETELGEEVLEKSDSPTLALTMEALQELCRGQLRPDGESASARYQRLRILYRRITDQAWINPKGVDETHRLDPLHDYFVFPGGTPEMAWLRAGLNYLKAHADPQFAKLFWQTIRVRCLYYRYLVQRPLTPGLLYFVRHFRRLNPGRRAFSERFIMEAALKSSGSEEGLRSLEIRTSPGDSPAENRIMAKFFEEAYTCSRFKGTVKEWGVVLHFTKERARPGVAKPFGKNTHADPSWVENSGTRYSKFYRQRHLQARALARAILNFPSLLGCIRGLDLCTDELGCPGWIFAPLFRYVREAAHSAAGYLNSLRYPLRVTIHAGEDFVHLAGGLRRVDESLRYFGLREGDRLGHAIALGIDPKAWAEENGPILMTAEERLWDLVWMYSFTLRQGIAFARDTLPQLEREANRLSLDIFGESLSHAQLEDLYESMYSEDKLLEVGYPLCLNRPESRDTPLQRYFTSSEIYDKGQRLIWIRHPKNEADILAALQERLRQVVSNRSITIEINPTSNLLVGNLADLAGHPLWRLNPPRQDPSLTPVKICIGSDDPSVFATRLPEEYQLLLDALIAGGCPEPEALSWLDGVRDASMTSRFTLPAELMEKIYTSALPGPPLQEPRSAPY